MVAHGAFDVPDPVESLPTGAGETQKSVLKGVPVFGEFIPKKRHSSSITPAAYPTPPVRTAFIPNVWMSFPDSAISRAFQLPAMTSSASSARAYQAVRLSVAPDPISSFREIICVPTTSFVVNASPSRYVFPAAKAERKISPLLLHDNPRKIPEGIVSSFIASCSLVDRPIAAMLLVSILLRLPCKETSPLI